MDRDKQKVPTFVFRRYSEIQELHHKLVVMFPLARLPSLPGKYVQIFSLGVPFASLCTIPPVDKVTQYEQLKAKSPLQHLSDCFP